ncbi:MAG: hypothetical protein ACYTGP_12845 [Planctomycetota bacterium]
MAPVTVRWNRGMTVAVLLLVAGGVLVALAEDINSTLYRVGFGILVLASAVYFGSRIWMMTRKKDR